MSSGRKTVRITAIVAGAAVMVFAVVLALSLGRDKNAARGIALDQPAPSFDLPDLGGGRVRLADLRGKAVIVNFWNEWCVPCRNEHPALKQFYEEHKDDRDFAFVGITREPDNTKAVQKWVHDNEVDWTIALDPTRRAAIDYGTTGQPETYAISPRGRLVGKYLAQISVAQLEQMLAAARKAG
jgi:cytochrome c biogenesis protein CcmG/thiol:disulfide interchange protein DsbE